MKQTIVPGSTSRSIRIFIRDTSVTGAVEGLAGLTYDEVGLLCHYIREGDTGETVIGLANATVGTWTSGGFKEIDPVNFKGFYEFGIPNAVIAAGADDAIIRFTGAANMEDVAVELQLDNWVAEPSFTLDDIEASLTAILGAPAGASVSADIAALSTLLTTVNGKLPALVSGRVDASVGAMAANVITDAAVAAEMDKYTGIIQLAEDADEDDTTDVWTVEWYKNNERVTSGVTGTALTVRALVAGTTLISAETMTEFSTTEVFTYQATGAEKAADGVAYLAEVTSTIDGSTRYASANVRG
jgi:hypothetical protein